MKTIRTLTAALMIACLGLTGARAETKPDEPKPAQTQTPGQLTNDQLKEMLDLLGYDLREEKSTNGASLFYVKVSRKGITYEINVNISPSKTKLWTSVGLAEVKPEHLAQADKLLKLLELNQKIGPSHFYYYAPHKFIYLAKPMDNRGVTAKILREHIDDLMEQVIANEEHWDVKKWGAAAVNKTEK